MSKKLSDDELKELFIKVVRPFEEKRGKKDIVYESPHVEKIEEFVKLQFIKESEARKTPIEIPKEPNTIILAYRNNEKEVRALMRHLRNCIAHCIIKKSQGECNSYELVDRDDGKNRNKACYMMVGNIEITLLNKLVDYINTANEELNSIMKSRNKGKEGNTVESVEE